MFSNLLTWWKILIKKRKLGKTKLDVSEIGLGGWQLGAPVQINNEPGTVFGGLD